MMRHPIGRVLILGALLLVTISIFGQQVPDIAQLKAAIEKLERVAHDGSLSPEVKELNERFLKQRRAQLQVLLHSRISALQEYRTQIGSTLSSDEKAEIDRSIQTLTRDLDGLSTNGSSTLDASVGKQEATSDRSGPGAAVTDILTAEPPPSTDPRAITPPTRPPTPLNGGTPSSGPNVVQGAAAAPPPCNLKSFRSNPKAYSLVDSYICNLVESVKLSKTGDPVHFRAPQPLSGIDLDAAFSRLMIILEAKKGRTDELVRAEESRTDKQVGGGSANSGSTSLVVKGNVPAILGFAVENGALVEDKTGSTITFRGNPVGIFKALAGQGLAGGYDLDDRTTRFLRRFSFAASFDTDRGSQPGVFTGMKEQLSEISGRAVLYDKRDPRRGEYKKDWEDFLTNAAQSFLTTDAAVRGVLLDTSTAVSFWKDPAMNSWFVETQKALAAASPDQVEDILIKQLNDLPIDKLSSDFNSELAKFETQFNLFLRDRNAILKKIGKAGVLTLDYSNQRNINKPDLSNFRLVGEKGFLNGRLDVTGNASLSAFNTRPVGSNIGRLRDAQAALQIDRTFGSAERTGVFVLSFGYKYQHLAENSMTQVGTIVPNTKGNISVGQLKLTVPIKGLGIKFPISVTFANRTELVKEKTVRGNFGFTFDLDSIFAKFKPF